MDDEPAKQARGNTEQSGHGGHMACSLSDKMRLSVVDEEIVITSIRVSDVALGLRRIPAGFYALVRHGDLVWKTGVERASTNDDIIEWSGLIPISSELSAIVSLEIRATFELQPILGDGEQLRELKVTVEQLLESAESHTSFTFLQIDEEVVTPCSSILVTVERRKRDDSDLSTSNILEPYRPTTRSRCRLEDATNRGQSALSRYRKHGENRDLKCSIEEFEHALRVCPLDHPGRAAAESNLATSKHILCRVQDADASSELISLYRNALASRPVGHVDRPSTLILLATLRLAWFEKLGDEREREQAEALLYEAIELSSLESHENQAASFMLQLYVRHNLEPVRVDRESAMKHNSVPRAREDKLISSDLLLERFERFGDLGDLKHAITALEELLTSGSIPAGDVRYHQGLANLGVALSHRFRHLGDLRDLEEAISRHKEAAQTIPQGHPEQPCRLNNLGNAFKVRFLRLGELHDLEDAVSTLKGALGLTPNHHPLKPTLMKSLGNSLRVRFERLGELSDLEDAIQILTGALDLTPYGHPDEPGCLNSLGIACKSRFERFGESRDLENAIAMLRDAVNLAPDDHPEKAGYLRSLGNAFLARFQRLGELSDIENAILILEKAVDLTPHGHSVKFICLANLGTAFQARFKRLGELADLENAISTRKDAANLTPNDHPSRATLLNNLGNSFKARFEHIGQLSDLDDAISMLRDAINLTPDGDLTKPGHLNNLGNALQARFKRIGDLRDIEDAISIYRGAVDLISLGHPHKPILLNGLGCSLRAHFQRFGQLSKLEEAIARHKDAVDLMPDNHPDKPARLFNLSGSFLIRFVRNGNNSDLEEVISLYSSVAATSIGPIRVRFEAAKKMDILAWIGHSLTHRFDELKRGTDLVREAAAEALDLGLLDTAVEWLEQGRSIVWGELFRLRSSYEELSAAYPDHASRLRELSAALEQAGAARENSLSQLSGPDQIPNKLQDATKILQGVANKHRSLAIERDKLLQEIRSFPGFERFLLYKEFSELRKSACFGPVVILNAADKRCDALIIRADFDHVTHVPLPNFTFKRSVGLHNMLEELLSLARTVPLQEREGRTAVRSRISWESLLSTLWTGVVKPVLDALSFSTPGDLSRIFWCPTGPFMFLPIHAAGLYDAEHSQPGHKTFDFVVSSYAPAISILGQASVPAVVPRNDLRLLTIRQPASDGLSKLPGVTIELNQIKQVIRNSESPSLCITLSESSKGTVEEVLSLMTEADWVHFACHGIQEGVDSGLCLADGRRLRLRDMIGVSRPRGGLAFLSACQTATGDEHLSDEAIHVAAGMLFAGYGGVIGTMWSISDKLAPEVASDVYARLFQTGVRPDHKEAALALHEAVGRLRERGNVSFTTWLPFIHVGL